MKRNVELESKKKKKKRAKSREVDEQIVRENKVKKAWKKWRE